MLDQILVFTAFTVPVLLHGYQVLLTARSLGNFLVVNVALILELLQSRNLVVFFNPVETSHLFQLFDK